jgi:formate/nitrite transporter FocA (FNT family)
MHPGNMIVNIEPRCLCMSQAMVPIGMLYGAHVDVGEFIVRNLLPAIAGNIVGGGFLIGGKHHTSEKDALRLVLARANVCIQTLIYPG